MAQTIDEGEAATFSLVEQAEECEEGLLERDAVQGGRRYRWAPVALGVAGGVAAIVAVSGQVSQRQLPAAVAESMQLTSAKPLAKCIVGGAHSDGVLRKWDQVCGDYLKIIGNRWQGTELECKDACERNPGCFGVQWIAGPDKSLARCIFQKSEILSSGPYTPALAGGSSPPLDPQCWFKCKCTFQQALTCPLDCESAVAADTIQDGAFKRLSNTPKPTTEESTCQTACENTATCTGYVTQKVKDYVGLKCFGVKGPTSEVVDGELNYIKDALRPLVGVQLGACGLQWPKKSEVSDKCTKEEKNEHKPWTYDEQTSFLTCRQAPWAKCGMYGDPHVATFDRPYASADCPTTPGSRDSGKQTVGEQGTYSLVRQPKPKPKPFNQGGRLVHVIGKFGYTTQHRSVASTKGVAVEGKWLGDNALVVELSADAHILVKWGPPGNQVTIFDVNPKLQNTIQKWNDKTREENPRLFAQLTWVKNTRLSSADKAKQKTKYPLLYFALRDPSGQDFMRVFVQGLKVDKDVKEQFLDVIVTMQKNYRKDQDGICGNFNCAAKDDKLTAQQMQELKVATTLFTAPFDYAGPANSPGSFSPQEFSDFKKKCQESNVAKGLRQGCAEDIAALAVKDDEAIQSVINGYQVFSTAWLATR